MTPTDNDLTIIRPLSAQILLLRDPSGQIRRVPLLSGEMTVGRGADNALVLDQDDQSVSRHHAVITVDGPVVMIADRGSTNGVLVNGVRVERAALKPGDEVRLGKTVLTIEGRRAPARRPAVGAGRTGRFGRKKAGFVADDPVSGGSGRVGDPCRGDGVFRTRQARPSPATPRPRPVGLGVGCPAVPPPAAPTALPVKNEPATAPAKSGQGAPLPADTRTYRPRLRKNLRTTPARACSSTTPAGSGRPSPNGKRP